MEQKFAPAMRTADEFKQAREQVARMTEANSFASSFKADLQKLPRFDEHKAEIVSRLAALKLQTDHPAEVKAATLALYNEIVLPKLAQGLTQTAQTKLLDNLTQKAAASTSVNPGSSAPATQKAYKSFKDLPAEAWK